MNAAQIPSLIDHTLLRPQATPDEVVRLCTEAVQFGFASVCVNPFWISLVSPRLQPTQVKACSVVGFPLGATYTSIKAQEASQAISDGAREIDVVMNIGALLGHRPWIVENDIREVVRVCQGGGALCKVILETALLNLEQKRQACTIALEAGADFLKTSTGFGPGGATVEDVALLSQFAKPAGKGVKASGGIRNLADLLRMVQAGATRIGTSSGVAIMAELRAADGR